MNYPKIIISNNSIRLYSDKHSYCLLGEIYKIDGHYVILDIGKEIVKVAHKMKEVRVWIHDSYFHPTRSH